MDRYCRVGVDIDGTLTDLVVIDDVPEKTVGEILITPKDPSDAVEGGLAELRKSQGVTASLIRTLVHDTSLVTTALIEHKDAKTALLTTSGLFDVIAICTQHRPSSYDIFVEAPEPVVPRPLRYELHERVLGSGVPAMQRRTS